MMIAVALTLFVFRVQAAENFSNFTPRLEYQELQLIDPNTGAQTPSLGQTSTPTVGRGMPRTNSVRSSLGNTTPQLPFRTLNLQMKRQASPEDVDVLDFGTPLPRPTRVDSGFDLYSLDRPSGSSVRSGSPQHPYERQRSHSAPSSPRRKRQSSGAVPFEEFLSESSEAVQHAIEARKNGASNEGRQISASSTGTSLIRRNNSGSSESVKDMTDPSQETPKTDLPFNSVDSGQEGNTDSGVNSETLPLKRASTRKRTHETLPETTTTKAPQQDDDGFFWHNPPSQSEKDEDLVSHLGYLSLSTHIVFLFVTLLLSPTSHLRPCPVSLHANTLALATHSICHILLDLKPSDVRFQFISTISELLTTWIRLLTFTAFSLVCHITKGKFSKKLLSSRILGRWFISGSFSGMVFLCVFFAIQNTSSFFLAVMAPLMILFLLQVGIVVKSPKLIYSSFGLRTFLSLSWQGSLLILTFLQFRHLWKRGQNLSRLCVSNFRKKYFMNVTHFCTPYVKRPAF